jgi:hypothetical protein
MAELAKSEFKTLAKTENILLICFYSIWIQICRVLTLKYYVLIYMYINK